MCFWLFQAVAVGLWWTLVQLLHRGVHQPAAVDQSAGPDQSGLPVNTHSLLNTCDFPLNLDFSETVVFKECIRFVCLRCRSLCPVRSWQVLSFDKHAAAFVRIVGTHNTANEVRAACGGTLLNTSLCVSDLLPMIPAGLSLCALWVSRAAGLWGRPWTRSVPQPALVMLLTLHHHHHHHTCTSWRSPFTSSASPRFYWLILLFYVLFIKLFTYYCKCQLIWSIFIHIRTCFLL